MFKIKKISEEQYLYINILNILNNNNFINKLVFFAFKFINKIKYKI